MQSANARPSMPLFQSNKPFSIAMILVILAAIGLSAYYAFSAAQARNLAKPLQIVSEQMLAEDYGLKVNLIAVTAAGGMVDLRLQITNGEKAKALLGDQANFPTLRAANGDILRASEDIASQEIKFDTGSNIFVLYPNSQTDVKSGDRVNILFGDLQVEAIQTK